MLPPNEGINRKLSWQISIVSLWTLCYNHPQGNGRDVCKVVKKIGHWTYWEAYIHFIKLVSLAWSSAYSNVSAPWFCKIQHWSVGTHYLHLHGVCQNGCSCVGRYLYLLCYWYIHCACQLTYMYDCALYHSTFQVMALAYIAQYRILIKATVIGPLISCVWGSCGQQCSGQQCSGYRLCKTMDLTYFRMRSTCIWSIVAMYSSWCTDSLGGKKGKVGGYSSCLGGR